MVHKSGPRYILPARLFSAGCQTLLCPGLSSYLPMFFHESLPVTKVSAAHRNLSQGSNPASVQGCSLKNAHHHVDNNEKLDSVKMPSNNSPCLPRELSLIPQTVSVFRLLAWQHIKMGIHTLHKNSRKSFNQSPFNQHVGNLTPFILSLENFCSC